MPASGSRFKKNLLEIARLCYSAVIQKLDESGGVMKFKLTFVYTALILASFACNSFMSSPSDTVKNFADYLRNNKPEEATNLFSASFIAEQGGKQKVVEKMKELTSAIEKSDRLRESLSFEIEEETIVADAASVKTKFINRNGNVGNNT